MNRFYRLGRVTVDPQARKVAVDGELVAVGSRALDILLALIRGRGGVVTKQDLLDIVWPGLVVEEANVQVQISALRKIVGHDAIATIPGLGYRLCITPQVQGIESEASARESTSHAIGVEQDLGAFGSKPLPAHLIASLPDLISDPLPPPPGLLGREADVQALRSLLESRSPVSIVGPGGIGKTALALAVAHAVASHQRVRWVDLTTVAAVADLVPTIARTVGLPLGPAAASASRLSRALSNQFLLIVLDNCEHLADGVAGVIDAISSAAPNVRVLATSQHRLQVLAERVYRLEPLPVPPSQGGIDEARQYAALLLLERRAQAIDRHFVLEAGAIADVIELSRRLDGIPLAIEMAAARLPTLGATALLNGLRDRIANLRNPSRGAPERQKTLQAMLDWSYSLLDDSERAVLRRLSAFSGSFRLEAAIRVGGGSESVGDGAVVDAIAGLVDKSLIQVQSSQPPRYRLLETTRSFAGSRLGEKSEANSVHRDHASAMTDLAVHADQSYWESPTRKWHHEYLPDYADLQAAFDHAVTCGDAAVAGATGDTLQKLDVANNTSGATRRRIEAAFALVGDAAPLARARLWNCIVTPWLSAAPRSVGRLEAAKARVDSWNAIGDVRQIYRALGMLAVEHARGADRMSQAQTSAKMCALEEASWPPRLRWDGLWTLAHACEFAGDAVGCVDARRRALAIATLAGDDGLMEISCTGLAEAALLSDDAATVIELTSPLIDRFRLRADTAHLVWALERSNSAWVLAGNIDAARGTAAEIFEIHRQMDTLGAALTTLALFAVASGQADAAARMLGFADAWLEAESMLRPPVDIKIAQEAVARIDALVGPDERARHRATGASLSTSETETLVRALLS